MSLNLDKNQKCFVHIEDLPQIRGRYGLKRSLAKTTWFQVGGEADLTVKPVDVKDLVCFLENKPSDLPVLCLGVGSNILVRSGGIRGAVVRLGGGFSFVRPLGNGKISVGAGTLDRQVALEAQSLGLGGFSFLAGIPGTIGGAVFMNAGCYGSEIKDILVEATVVDQKGVVKRMSNSELDFAYRTSGLSSNEMVVEAVFQGYESPQARIQKEIDEIMEARVHSQPIKSRTGGSTFANPEGHSAWKLIDQAGCRGLRCGRAIVSPMHCNF